VPESRSGPGPAAGVGTGPPALSTAAALARAAELAAGPGPRRILGLAGPPGAGKSTLAVRLAAAAGPRAVVVPLDGFHLADAELTRLGRLGRKGAPDTFDAAGYVALLRRLRQAEPGVTVYAPAFGRKIEQPIAGSIPVPSGTRLVITEGNYLLLDEPPWTEVRGLLDEVWWVGLAAAERRRRLIARHVRWGKTPAAAERFVAGCDQANARAVAPGRGRADRVVWVG
jgi:pantothenate kinase